MAGTHNDIYIWGNVLAQCRLGIHMAAFRSYVEGPISKHTKRRREQKNPLLMHTY